MKSRATVFWLTVAAMVIALGIFFALTRREKISAPPVVFRADFPAPFNDAVRTAAAAAQAHPRDPAPLRKLAHLYQANRLYPEARACFRILAQLPPGLDARDHYALADLAQNEGDLESALKELKAVLALAPQYLPARLSCAEALFKSDRSDEAKKEYAAILTLSPLHPQATVGLARVELQRGDDPAAIALLEKLLAAHPESTAAAALLAQVLSRRGETERAEALGQWSRQRHEPVPDDPWLAEWLEDCYDSQRLALKFEEYFFGGQPDLALPLLRRIEEINPTSAIPPLLRGWSRARLNQDEAAVAEFRLALARGGDAEKILPLLVASLLKLDRVPEAVAIAAEYHVKAPTSQPFLVAYGDALLRSADEKKTRAVLTEILADQPYLYSQNLELAKILWKAGERDEAAKCLGRIVQFYPNDVTSRGLLGQYYLEKSEPQRAIAPLEQALTQTATGTPARERLTAMLTAAYLQAAAAAAERGNFSAAIDCYDGLLRIDPKQLDAYFGKANACVQLKQFARATEVLEQMATLDPGNPTILLSWGDVLFQGGDAAQARRRWTQALPLVSRGDAKLRQALEQRIAGRISAEDFK